eukprot:1161348-Pelagomonas_calceolata.AAC.14
MEAKVRAVGAHAVKFKMRFTLLVCRYEGIAWQKVLKEQSQALRGSGLRGCAAMKSLTVNVAMSEMVHFKTRAGS